MAKMITIVRKNGEIVFRDFLVSLPVSESCIRLNSMELFDESEPCILYRTYVLKKVQLELDEYFSRATLCGEREFTPGQLPPEIRRMFAFNGDDYTVTVFP